jgi:hypothetical protein
MNEAQRAALVKAAQLIAAALGPDVAADQPAKLQGPLGFAYIVGRMGKTAGGVRALAGAAVQNYLPEPEPTAAPAGKGEA